MNKYNYTKRAEIPANFTISERLEISNLVNLRNKDYLLWVLSRYLADTREENVMPSWSASNSAKYNKEINNTSIAFIPILPHPATSYDSIFTSIIKFENAGSRPETYPALYGVTKAL